MQAAGKNLLLPAPQPGVEQIAQGIAEHVEAEYCGAQRHPRPDGQPGGLIHVAQPLQAQHAAPGRMRWWHPEAEKAQRGLDEDEVAQANGGHHDDDRRHIGSMWSSMMRKLLPPNACAALI